MRGGGSSCRRSRGCRRRRSTGTTTSSGRTRRSCPGLPDEIVGALAGGDVRRLAAALHNDLEQAACELRPELAQLIVEGVDAGALRGLVSGSGPTCVFLCESAEHARSVAGVLQEADGQRVVLVAHGPVAGAHVVVRE